MSYALSHRQLGNAHCGRTGFGQADAPPPSSDGAAGNNRVAVIVFGGIMVGLGFLAYLRFKTTADIARSRGVGEALKYEAGMAGIQALRDITSRPVSRNRRRGRRRRR